MDKLLKVMVFGIEEPQVAGPIKALPEIVTEKKEDKRSF